MVQSFVLLIFRLIYYLNHYSFIIISYSSELMDELQFESFELIFHQPNPTDNIHQHQQIMNPPPQPNGREQRGRIQETSTSSRKQPNHNSAAQLIITIKRMMKGHINSIYTLPERKRIINKVWKIFIQNPNLNKQILCLMFNERFDRYLIEEYNFTEIFRTHTLSDYRSAMEDLRQKIRLVMNRQSIQQHLTKRRIQNKEEALIYILNFIENELGKEKIKSRRTSETPRIIQMQIIRRASEYQFDRNSFIESPIEVLQSDASLNNADFA